jgi:LSD1 subclass zinc finger protein
VIVVGVWRLKPFLVFKCSKCKNFTNAPAGQKRRRCSYCGTIIDITKAACALFDSPEQASTAVKEFNAARGGDEFQKSVERSRERVLALMPKENMTASDISDGETAPTQPGKRKRLMSLLEKEAKKAPISLDRIEELCEKYELDWKWVEGQLEKLSNNGTVIFPRPWSVQLVALENKESEDDAVRDVTVDILALLSESEDAIRVVDLIKRFEEKGIGETSVVSSLEKLMQKGEIFEPRSGHVRLV